MLLRVHALSASGLPAKIEHLEPTCIQAGNDGFISAGLCAGAPKSVRCDQSAPLGMGDKRLKLSYKCHVPSGSLRSSPSQRNCEDLIWNTALSAVPD
ncbi:hypothetical protein BQ8482_120064 [Mesorhizobium delmotii]|uniref:Uncharacterized protein n=1 Tax=Mesorhizobium delmotii TaxID=1631247 RepID=A0A2P9AFX2_9HYPH|nr:hypothetical protein BQ8482_120064 [Mesorhizobium delmotii]